MNAEAIFYASEALLPEISRDLSLQQLQNTASLPDIVSPVIAMPDAHQGYGVPVGGVLATHNLISAGAVGMDINCGVRLLVSQLTYDPEKFNITRLHQLINQLEHLIPIGLGGRHKHNPINFDLKEITGQGSQYLAKKGLATPQDIEHTEEYGCLDGANYHGLSERAVIRARDELGTLGSGNHFIDILKVVEIFDTDLAQKWHLFENQICVMIHSGSRALGHQTCLDYLKLFNQVAPSYGISFPNRELAALPLTSKEAQAYFGAMKACVNFAFANRQLMTYFVRNVFQKNFQDELPLLYDVAHNIAKWEVHHGQKMLVHRKGATRALPAGHPQNPKSYLETGHPAIVPGSMGTASYVLVGLPKNAQTFHSVNHGAGRRMSRTQAKKTIREDEFKQKMGETINNKPFYRIADEAPQAYKDIDQVVETLTEIGLTKKVVKLLPLAVINGE
ncbi:hypothetical protein A2160_03095 [Candidatus Beckwithbacteria bacterium RBG_13_42_9]|uniref:tRNA-splicing ligase RtcB n=1 Tax=Candidatus Beckwithbacteria bacterium RBG_13_42_9 TaxID=1797457 RepID=A0A1F5E7W1_9BACT|nr:MAG: hypothetical protein A2160_03095 [Candidatus Beckwithbacteria bacterium RBG_13_42_9]